MRFIIIADIEGVSGITTYKQAESEQIGKDMLMHDLLAVIDGINSTGQHEIIIYDMHVQGRNIDITQLPQNVSVIMGKPINRSRYKCVGGQFDGLFMVGFHSMSDVPGAMLAHSFLKEYKSIRINGELLGEVGVEAALAGTQGIPLLFVSGDDMAAREAKAANPHVCTAIVKQAIGECEALCKPTALSSVILNEAAANAVNSMHKSSPKQTALPLEIEIQFFPCRYLEIMRTLHPEIFISNDTVRVCGDDLLQVWTDYIVMEREMLNYE